MTPNSDITKAKKGSQQYAEWLRKYLLKRHKALNENDIQHVRSRKESSYGREVCLSALQEAKARDTAGEVAKQLHSYLKRCSGTNSQESSNHERAESQRRLFARWLKDHQEEFFYQQELIDTCSDFQNLNAHGAESIIFFDKESNNVLKLIDPFINSDSMQDFIENRIYTQNLLFPEAAYTLEGFTMYDGTLRVMLSQPFIVGRSIVQEDNIAAYLDTLGFKYNKQGHYFENEFYRLEDIHSGNVLKTSEGSYAFIDPIITML